MFCLLGLCVLYSMVTEVRGQVDISPDLYKNVLKPEWGTNFKFNGHIHHNLDRVWVVTKLPLPLLKDIHDHPLSIDTNCTFLWNQEFKTEEDKGKLRKKLAMVSICRAMGPTIRFIQTKERYLKSEIERFYEAELYTVLPELQSTGQRQERSVTGLLTAVSGLVTIGVEALSTHLQRKRNEAMEKAMDALREEHSLDRNQLKQYKEDLIMYGKYSVDSVRHTLETLNDMHNRTSLLERVLLGKESAVINRFLGNAEGPALFGFDLQLYLAHVREEHTSIYEELIGNLHKLLKGIEKLSKGYLPAELFPPSELNKFTESVERMVKQEHSEYKLTLEHLGSYYDMKLVTLSVDRRDHSLVVTFPVFIHPNKIEALTLYEIETVQVPIPDTNHQADSYTEALITKPYIAVNGHFYIQLRMQELRMCKQIKFEYYCEELFLVKHRAVETCESALYFSKDNNTIIRACDFKYSFDSAVIPSVLDGGVRIVLANMVNHKRLVCSSSFNLGAPLPSYKYVTVSRSILCNCEIDAGLSYVLRSVGSCVTTKNPPRLLFTTNLAFQATFKELWQNKPSPPVYSIDEIEYPVYLNRSTSSHKEPKSLRELQEMVKVGDQWVENWKEKSTQDKQGFKFIHSDSKRSNKAHTIFAVVIAVTVGILVVGTVYLAMKYYKTKAIVAGMSLLALPSGAQAHEVTKTVVCSESWMSILAVTITLLGAVIYLVRQIKKMNWLRGFRFETVTKVYLIVTSGSYYVPIKIITVQAPAFMIAQEGVLTKAKLQIKHHCVWDTISIDWKDVKVFKDTSALNVPNTLTVPFKDKIKFRFLTMKGNYSVFLLAQQGDNWANLRPWVGQEETPDQETEN